MEITKEQRQMIVDNLQKQIDIISDMFFAEWMQNPEDVDRINALSTAKSLMIKRHEEMTAEIE